MQIAQEKINSLSDLKETSEYTELQELHKTGISPIKSAEITGSLKGRTNVLSRMRELLESATKEILICTSVSDFEDKSRVLLPTIQKLNKKKVKVKIALSGEQDEIRKINAKFGLKVHQIETPARFFLSDKSEVLFMITPESAEEQIAIWLHSPFFSASLSGMLEVSLRAR